MEIDDLGEIVTRIENKLDNLVPELLPVVDPEPPVVDPEPPVVDPEPPVVDPEPPVHHSVPWTHRGMGNPIPDESEGRDTHPGKQPWTHAGGSN